MVGIDITMTTVTPIVLALTGASQLASAGNQHDREPAPAGMHHQRPFAVQPALQLRAEAAAPEGQRRRAELARRGERPGTGRVRHQGANHQRRHGADHHIGDPVDGDRERSLRLGEGHQHHQASGDGADQPGIAEAGGGETEEPDAGQDKQAQAERQRLVHEQPEDDHADRGAGDAAGDAHDAARDGERERGAGHHEGGNARPPGIVGMHRQRREHRQRHRQGGLQRLQSARAAKFERAQFAGERAGDLAQHRPAPF